MRVVALPRGERKSDCAAERIDRCGELGVEAALGASHRLGRLPADGVGAILVNFDMGAVHAADLPVGFGRKDRKQTCPQTRGAPAAEARANRTPRTKLPRQVAPRNPRSKYITDASDEGSIILRRPIASVTICQIPFSGRVRSIFLAAPTAAPATQSDLPAT